MFAQHRFPTTGRGLRIRPRFGFFLPFAAVVLALPPGLAAQDARAAGGRPVELEDYYRLKGVGSPALSPDGSRVAYVVTSVLEEENRRHSEVWLANADGSGEPVMISSPGVDASSPQWNPDGSLLSFVAEGRVFVRADELPGEPFRIDGLSGSPVFSPDGAWIAFTAAVAMPPGPDPVYASDFERRVAERFDGRDFDWMNYRFDRRGYLSDPRDPRATPPREIHLIPAGGGEPRLLTELGVNAGGLAWSPDGARLAFTADASQRDEHSYERSDLWTVDLDGTVTRLTDDEYNYSSPAWSPDGDRIVVRGNEGLDVIIREKRDRGASTELFTFDAADGTRIGNLTAEWDLIPGSGTWSPDGRLVYFSAGIGGNTHLFRVPAGGGAVEQVTTGDRRLGGLSFSADFSRVAFTATDPVHPRDIWVARVDGDDETRITDVNGPLLADLDLAIPENLRFQSPDGTEVEGWILPGRGYGEGDSRAGFPMILLMHGGPHGAYGNDFSFDRQLLAAQGYMVLYTNPRASTGYGEDFRWGTWGGWGFNDYDDVMAGVDHAIANYDIDTTRMGVTGYSYGGYLTNWVITQTDRFAAAVAGAGISNWVSDYGVADIPRTKESEFYGPPWEERGLENLLRSSPLIYAKGVTTPTMFVHGELDYRVPIEEAEQMYVALRKQQVPARFVRYPESYHGGWTPWRTVHRTWVQLEWWSEWLSKRPASD
ncbi:MAG: S9 family peptidase [Gemmatimonadetes bacterium]|nr:S9 family peptidase [Gemmatimonadota bacterium]